MTPLRTFPLPRWVQYTYASRFTPTHRGIDIFAPRNAPVVAVEAGRAYARIEPKGGNVAYLEGDSGWVYFYGHLAKWSLPVARPEGVRVQPGDELGLIGTSGNAAGKSPHLHFQMRFGSLVVDPFREITQVDPKLGGLDRTAILVLLALWALASQSCQPRSSESGGAAWIFVLLGVVGVLAALRRRGGG